MGGGNGQKSKEARERNMAKKLKDQKQKNHETNKGKMAADKESTKCKICLTAFMVTANVRPPVLMWICYMNEGVNCVYVCLCSYNRRRC